MSTDPTRPSFNVGDPVRAADLNKLANQKPAIQAGPGVTSAQSDAGTVLQVPGGTPRPKQTFYARIEFSSPAGDNRWTYSWQEVIKDGRGFGNWTSRTNGRQGLFFDEAAGHNFYEEMNSGSGVQGHGIDIDDLPAGFATVPCPNGQIVLMYVVPLADGTGYEHWFHFTNDVDGSCDA